MYDQLTDTELAELSICAYRGTVRLFDAAARGCLQLAQLPVNIPEYADLRRKTGVLMAAGREQKQMYDEVMALIRYRQDSALRLAALTFPDDEVALLREFSLIDAADRRDDPLMREDIR